MLVLLSDVFLIQSNFYYLAPRALLGCRPVVALLAPFYRFLFSSFGERTDGERFLAEAERCVITFLVIKSFLYTASLLYEVYQV